MGHEYNVKVNIEEKLREGNWAKWSKDMEFTFMEAGIMDYIDGTYHIPIDEKMTPAWKSINSRIVGTLGKHVEDSLKGLLTSSMLTREAWGLLKLRTQQGGLLAKMSAITTAICSRFDDMQRTNVTIAEIDNAIVSIYEGGIPPTQDKFTILVYMNALRDTDLDWVRKNLLTLIGNSKKTITKTEVAETIKLAAYEKMQSVAEKANVAKTTTRSGQMLQLQSMSHLRKLLVVVESDPEEKGRGQESRQSNCCYQ